MKTMSFLGIMILLAWLLAGCAGRVQSVQQPAEMASAADEAEIDAVLSRSDDTRGGSAVLLVTLDDDGRGLQGRPVDPATLANLPGHEPINFGHHYTYAVSPDGQTLALITWPSGSHNRGGVLHLVDLQSWAAGSTEVTFDDYVSNLAFDSESERLYWIKPISRDGAHGMPRDYTLYRYHLNSREVTAVVSFPSSFTPWEMRVLRDGSQLAVYGVPTDRNNLIEDAPHVILVNLATGHIAADVRLEGLTAGQLKMKAAEDGNPYRMYWPGLAWDLEHNRLHVVHANADRVTVVDLVEGAILRETVIRPQLSMLDRLMRWLVPAAEAKMVPGTEKRAVLSPDGRRLYVFGRHTKMEREENSQDWVWREEPLGLQVLATDDLTELYRLDIPVNDVAVSPDGKWLLLTGVQEMVSAESNQIERIGHGLYVFDAKRLEEVAHLQPETELWLHGFSPHGRYAYVSSATAEWLGNSWGNWRVKLHVLDLTSQRFVAEREFEGYVLDVVRSIDDFRAILLGTPAKPTSVAKTPPADCPVTQSPDPPFVPPPPYSSKTPSAGYFWYGTDALWTAVPRDGVWAGLPHNPEGYTQKVFWWREGYNWRAEPQPELTVTGRRLDAPAPPLNVSRATNAFAEDIGSAMLVGVDFPTLGCWEIMGQYGDHALSFVVWVAP